MTNISQQKNINRALNSPSSFILTPRPSLMNKRQNAIQHRPQVVMHVLSLIFLFLSICIHSHTAGAEPLVRIVDGVQWHYFKGTKEPPRHWTHVKFDDSGWDVGSSGIGYGSKKENTILPDMQGSYKRVHARRKFSVPNPGRVRKLNLSLVCDGPFITYINGIEALRSNSGLAVQDFDLSGFSHELLPGDNVLSIQCDNDDLNSENFSFTPRFEVHGQ